MQKLPIYKIKVDEVSSSLHAISYVHDPAFEVDLMAFNSQNEEKEIHLSEEKQMIVSPILIPNKLIFRRDSEGYQFNIYFDKEAIAELQYLFMKKKHINDTTIDHSEKVEGVVLMEIWMKESENDKSKDYGFGDLPVGTLFVKQKIDNLDLWADIKSEKYKGLSVETLVKTELIKLSNIEPKKVDIMALDNLFNKLGKFK